MDFKKIVFFYIVIILISFGFILIKPYFFLDEPNVLWEIKQGIVWKSFFYRFLSEGRPFYGWLQINGITLAGSIAQFWYLRIISLILTFLFARYLFIFLCNCKIDYSVAFIITVLIFCLPGFSIFMAWSECFPQHLSSILSFSAGILTYKAFGCILQEDRISKKKENLYVFYALVLQTIALLNYQGMALVFILPGFFALFIKSSVPTRERIRFFKYYILIFFVSIALYYLIYKSILGTYQLPVINRGKIGNDYIGKIKWFFEIMVQASKLHLLLFKPFIVQYLFSFFTGLLILRDLYKKRWVDLLFLLIFCILSFLPHLLIAESWGASRNFLLMSALIVFYATYRCLEFLPFLRSNNALLITVPFLFILFININCGFTKPMADDYEYLKKKVQELPLLNQDSLFIEIKLPPFKMHEKNSFLRSYTDEFNVSPFSFEWPVAPAIKCLYSEQHPQIPIQNIELLLKVKTYSADHHCNKSIVWDLNYK